MTTGMTTIGHKNVENNHTRDEDWMDKPMDE